MTHDIRAIANFVLELAEKQGAGLTNMALNKIVYFLYEDSLLLNNEKLAAAKIEAWEHGPVFRELYSAFKKFGDKPIAERACKIDLDTGAKVICELSIGDPVREFCEKRISKFVGISASRLRNLSHLPGSPWDKVWNHVDGVNPGMQITDEIILDCFNNGWRQ
jgi:uncharacterized phage-associated protein